MKTLLTFLLIFQTVYGTLCPDRIHRCPSWGTCCENKDLKSYGCCPYKNADCCSDFIHCCPQGTHCNTTNGSCDSDKVSSTSFLWMVPSYDPEILSTSFEAEENLTETAKDPKENITLFTEATDITCPDGNSTCPDSTTCCKTLDGAYSCCPFANATCCTDQIHCCPDGYDCDIANFRCRKKSWLNISPEKILLRNEVNIEEKQEAVSAEVKPRLNKILNEEEPIVICEDKTESCPPENTCCPLASGEYGCCNQPAAICCKDKLTCCPYGYVCGDHECERLPSLRLFHLPVFTKKIKFI